MSTEPRESGWNTYKPWLLALTSTLSVITLFIVAVSWIPKPEIPGVPPEAYAPPLLPGGMGILMMVLAGRQLFLRNEAKR